MVITRDKSRSILSINGIYHKWFINSQLRIILMEVVQSERGIQVAQGELQITAQSESDAWKTNVLNYKKVRETRKWMIIVGLIFAFLIFGLLAFLILPPLKKIQLVGESPNQYQLPQQLNNTNEVEVKKNPSIVVPKEYASTPVTKNNNGSGVYVQEAKAQQTPVIKANETQIQPKIEPKIDPKIEPKIQTVPQIVQETITSSSQVYVNEEYIFDIPKKLWIYDTPKLSYMSELIHANIAHFAKKSKFELTILNRTNYKDHLSPNSRENLEQLITTLEKREKEGDTTNLKHHLSSIIAKLILFNVLNENGGVITDGEFAITEDLSWITQIIKNKYVNLGNRGIKPQIVGFYSVYYSLGKRMENIRPFPGMNNVDKFMITFPTLDSSFVAAAKNTRLLPLLISKMAKLLQKPLDFKQEVNKYQLVNLGGDDIYYEYFFIAYQTILQDKQKQIDEAKIDQYRHFAIDYYGLRLINSYYGPYKLPLYWGDQMGYKSFQCMTQFLEEEQFASTGPVRYISKLPALNEVNNLLLETKNGKRKPIMEGSFIQKLYYPNLQISNIKKHEQKKFVNSTNEPWLNLTKIIWIFWDRGLANAPVNNQICVQNLRRMGNLSGFVVNQVSTSNAHQYLDEETLNKIRYSLGNARLNLFPQSQSDLYRLALVAKHGGIYMDASYVALQSLDWLVNIGRYPSQYIFNRFGHLPKVFMMWHPQWGAPLDWVINEKYNIKTQWHLAYENNFIAAEKGSELIKEWFELLLQLYLKPYSEVDPIFRQCQISQHKWTSYGGHYLIPMDTIKCVVGRREGQLVKEGNKEFASASDYYKIWSMNGYLGQQKLRANTNFDRPGGDDNNIVYQYSQDYVEGITGKIRQVAKFYGYHNREMTRFLTQHINGDFSKDVHPDSFFMRHMWQKGFSLYWENGQVKLKTQ